MFRKSVLTFHILAAALLLSASTSFAQPYDTTRVFWNSSYSRLCFDRVVWCGLIAPQGIDFNMFNSFVLSRNGVIKEYNSYLGNRTALVLIEIPESASLTYEATQYQYAPYARYAGPCFIEMEGQVWPEDEDRYSQEYYLDDNLTGNLNWLPVARDLGQRGSEAVSIVLLDGGISTYVGGGRSHPDLSEDRFLEGPNFDAFHTDGNGYPPGIFDFGGHGSGCASVLGAIDHTDDPNNPNFGMIGVNTKSKILVVTFSERDASPKVTQYNAANAIAWCVSQGNFDIISYSYGYVLQDDIWEWLMEAFDVGANIGLSIPLCVFPTGNKVEEQEQNVMYPARHAFSGRVDRLHPHGSPYIMSIGGSNTDGSFCDRSSNDDLDNLCRVSCVAPMVNITYANARWWQNSGFFLSASGTSFSVPMVAGVASLVLSNNRDDFFNYGKQIRIQQPWELKIILQKTSRDILATGSGFDKKAGYGSVDCEKAYLNTDIFSYKLPQSSWYMVSSNVIPVYNDPRRVMEDLTYADAEHFNNVQLVRGLDPVTQLEYEYEPSIDLQPAPPNGPGWPDNPEWSWEYKKGYKIRMNIASQDSLVLCGKNSWNWVLWEANEVPPAIELEVGWNWIANLMKPDLVGVQPCVAFKSIVEPGPSDLTLAKDMSGNFYTPGFGFSNMLMQSGEGYMLQMLNAATLQYPLEPDIADIQDIDERPLPEHFAFKMRTGDFLPILITSVVLKDREVARGDELGIFTEDSLCIGGAIVDGKFPIGLAAWKDDDATESFDGYRDHRSLTLRYWDADRKEEVLQEKWEPLGRDYSDEPSYIATTARFSQMATNSSVPTQFSIESVYPNPFNSRSIVRFNIISDSYVRLSLYDVIGQIVSEPINSPLVAGSYSVTIGNNSLSSGIYFVRLSSGGLTDTRKVTLVK